MKLYLTDGAPATAESACFCFAGPSASAPCASVHIHREFAGKMTAWAVELHHCGALNTDLTAGSKVVLTNPVVHRGMLMLMGPSIRVLGGGVDRLEAARQRLLEHWNKPLGCSLLSVQVPARASSEQQAAFAASPARQAECAAGAADCAADDV